MSDLISRSTLLDFLDSVPFLVERPIFKFLVENWVEQQPTAYDVDEVVEKLDKASDYYECNEQGREHVQMVDLTEAIEIVRGGVING